MEDFVFGKNSVIELLNNKKRNVSKIIILKGAKDSKTETIISLAKERGIVFQFVPKEKFTKFSKDAHQGVVAYVAPVEYTELEDFLNKKKDGYKRVVILDGIEDPHNVGAIIRSAVCAGLDAVILPSRRTSLINSTVEKSSMGAVNLIDIVMVNSLSSTIDILKDRDFWIIASEAEGKDNYFDIDYCGMNFALVMGGEHSGISSTIMKKADFKVKIPMSANFNSLNVSNAAAIIMFEAFKQLLKNKNL
ncbi:23S rRNA (guanosine(2251)-2'-O)-methyltransferase RlmB [bacterium]|nr:23S rRNA (guanosine(2251)-2'-O)-methyltransferase RlmB [bacterium]